MQHTAANGSVTFATQAQAGFSAPTGRIFKGWSMATDGTGMFYSAGANQIISGNITLYAIWGPDVTTVTISKTVIGDFGDKTREFIFSVYFTDNSDTPLVSGTEFFYTSGAIPESGVSPPKNDRLTLGQGGMTTIPLKHGQSITIQDVPVDAKIKILEAQDDKYQIKFTDSASTAGPEDNNMDFRPVGTEARSFDFTNARIIVVPTGNDDDTRAMALLLFIALIMLLFYAVYARRKAKEET